MPPSRSPPPIAAPMRPDENATRPEGTSLACLSPPLVALEGPRGCFLGTEEGEWLHADADGHASTPPARLPPHSATLVSSEGELIVATYSGELARLRDGRWTHLPCEAVVLALAETAAGLVLGDTSGRLTCLEPGGGRRVLTVGEPVTGLATVGPLLAVLGSHGSLGVTSWPLESGAVLREVQTSPVDSPWRLWRAGSASLGLLGVTRAGLVELHERKGAATSNPFPEGLRDLAPLQDTPGYCLLTDPGELWLLDARLGSPQRVRLSAEAGAIRGMRPVRQGGVLVWTVSGELSVVEPSRRVRRVFDRDVVLAYPDAHPTRALAVGWSAAGGARLHPVVLG